MELLREEIDLWLTVPRKLMMENIVALKYWREAISTVVHTLNWVEVKKGTNAIPFELWYGHSPNVKHFKVFFCNAIFWKILEMESLMQKVMKAYFLDTPLEAKHISVWTLILTRLWRVQM